MLFNFICVLGAFTLGGVLGQVLDDQIATAVKPFNYDAARQYLNVTNPGLAETAGEPGGFWGCWLNDWDEGCHWWPPHDGCQNIDFENEKNDDVQCISSFGPDEGSACNVFGDVDCKEESKFWPYSNLRPGPNMVFRYPGNQNYDYNAWSFRCWKD